MTPSGQILRLPPNEQTRPQPAGSSIRNVMRPWGVTITDVAMEMGVSRQYIWQILYGKTPVSDRKAQDVERCVEWIIERRKSASTLGARLRTARIAAGLTLKQTAGLIGYSWVAVERWEKNVCVPKPGVLWHLRHVYGADDNWLPAVHPSSAPQRAI